MRVCFQGFSSEEAQEEYMQIVKGWAGFGATMFDVTVSTPHIFALHLTVCFAFSILFRHHVLHLLGIFLTTVSQMFMVLSSNGLRFLFNL